MSVAVLERPGQLGGGDGGVPARRAMVRWAWRLYRREWRQQVLVLALIAVAVTATILGAAVATNTAPLPNVGLGTANHRVLLPAGDPHLTADIAALKKQFATVDVIEDQRLAAGLVNGVDLRAQDPNGPFGRSLRALDSGRYPSGPNEVAVTKGVASSFNLRIGDLWSLGGHARRVVGLVENPKNLVDQFALVAPGQVSSPSQVSVLFDATPAAIDSFTFPGGAQVEASGGRSSGISPGVIVLVADTFGLLFIGLVAVAGFTVMAQRRLRAIGMLGALGATDRHTRLVMIANGAVVGLVATVVGAVAGFVAWTAYRPHLETSAGHRIGLLHLPWWLVGTSMALAVVTAIVAARWPATAVSRLPIVAALSGRPVPPRTKHGSVVRSTALLVLGLVLLWLASPSDGTTGPGRLELIGGIVATILGGLLLAPMTISGLAVITRRAPVAVRLALRDLARYRSRSGAALGAISFAVVIAVVICVSATSRYSDPVDFVGPNLPANQLVVTAPEPPPGAVGPSGAPGFTGPVRGPLPPAPPPTVETPAQLQVQVVAIAAAVGTRDVLGLQLTTIALTRSGGGSRSDAGPLYLATPELLRHFGINPDAINPTTDVLTSRSGLPAVGDLQLGADSFAAPGVCASATCINHPKIQTLAGLPSGTADPNLLVTAHALQAVGQQATEQPAPSAWLIETSRSLTAVQTNAARQIAAGAGMTITTKSQAPSLSDVTNWATAAGILLALGVLALTVGLIRSETSGDLRVLTAAGAGSTTRRTITSATAAALALLAVLVGTADAYLASLAFYRTKLGTTLSHVPVRYLIVITVTLPIAATVGGWVFAGRQPPVIARQPLE